MALVYTVDVFCDGLTEACIQWTNGATQGGSPNARKARKAADAAGWQRRWVVDDEHPQGAYRDLCPEHVAEHRAMTGHP
jgi:hypothetical protein